MNQTLSLLFSYHSDRSFSDEPVSEEALCSILEAARRAPTTSNAQHVSVVVVRDAARRARIAEFAGNQAWIALGWVKGGTAVELKLLRATVERAGLRRNSSRRALSVFADVDAAAPALLGRRGKG